MNHLAKADENSKSMLQKSESNDTTTNGEYNKLQEAYAYIRTLTDFRPYIALVLGSGLGGYASSFQVVCEVPYEEIPHLAVSTVQGHAGKFIMGYLNDTPVICMKGRVHFYEGYPISQVVRPIRLMGLLGAKVLLLTNAAGGINPAFHAGELMLIKDHISCFVPNPLIGANIEELGLRFPDMTHIYDIKLQDIFRKAALDNFITLQEGIYVQLTGSSFESPAEIRMLRQLGCDAVGMSTAVEAIAARHMGLAVCGISCISNMAAGMTDKPLNHEEVQEAADMAAENFSKLLSSGIHSIYQGEKA
jgi:purine-nucleoside phosphorylase